MKNFIRVADTLVKKTLITRMSINQKKSLFSQLNYYIHVEYVGGKFGEGSCVSEKYLLKSDAERQLTVLSQELDEINLK